MIKPQDLLQGKPHLPGPNAIPLVAEVRTGSSIIYHRVNPPGWLPSDTTETFGSMHEWSCSMTWGQVLELRKFLTTPVARTKKTPEALIDAAMRELQIGFYLGTFIANGQGGADVRMVFAYTGNIERNDLARTCAAFLTEPSKGQLPASRSLATLRRMWNAGSDRRESGLMLLANVDVSKELEDRERFPFASIDTL